MSNDLTIKVKKIKNYKEKPLRVITTVTDPIKAQVHHFPRASKVVVEAKEE